MVKLAIFDLDGTLINTLDDIAGACNYALRESGFPVHEPQEYLDFIGHGPVYLVERALPEQNRDEQTVLSTRKIFSDYYFEHALDSTRPYDGITDMLETAKASGVGLAVYSNKPHEGVVQLCGIYFPGLIDMAVGFRDGVKPKPDPAAGFEIMRRFGALPQETVYIGDSGVDMMTGKALGVYTVGVSWGFRPKSELLELGADVIIDKASELVKIIVDK